MAATRHDRVEPRGRRAQTWDPSAAYGRAPVLEVRDTAARTDRPRPARAGRSEPRHRRWRNDFTTLAAASNAARGALDLDVLIADAAAQSNHVAQA